MKKVMWFQFIWMILMAQVSFSQTLVDELKGSAYSHATGMTISNRSKDALSIFSNPGFLGNYEKIHADVVRVSLLEIATSYSAGVVLPIDSGFGVGFAINNKSQRKMASQLAFNNENNYEEQLFLLSLGKNIWSGLSFGFSMKAVQLQLDDQVSNRAFGADLGLTYQLDRFGSGALNRTILSASVENISQPILELGAHNVILPRFYQFGFEKTLDIPGGNIVLLSSLLFSESHPAKYRVGVEYAVGKIGKAAIGWDEAQRLCLGGGIHLGEFQVSAAHIYTSYAGYYSISIGYSARANWLNK